MNLYDAWLEAKAAEAEATERRRKIEDELAALHGVTEALEGTERFEVGDFEVKIVGRMNRKIDAEKLQEIAAESGLTDHLSTLFRWKPEINSGAWKATAKEITEVLAQAITTTPGRPSFSIERKE